MRTRNVVMSMAAFVALAVLGAAVVFAQDAPPAAGRPAGGDRGGRGDRRGDGRWDPQQWQQRELENVKEQLGIGEDDWNQVRPLVDKVLTLRRDAEPRRLMMFGGRFGRGGLGGDRADNPQPQTAMTPIATAREALQGTLDNKDAPPAEIKAKLTAFREAREKARQELAAAREALREVLTQRQEAQLVLMGILD